MIETDMATRPGTLPPQFRVLNSADATMVWVMSWAGDPNHIIAHKLGTMPGRVADVLAENTHVGSKEQASKLVTRP